MKDRIPTKPGRVALTDEETNVTKYYIMAMADEPVEEGTELNKATLLTDATAGLFGLTDAAVPDDILALIASGRAQIETGSYVGTGTKGESNPNTLTFGFEPKMVLIVSDTGSVNRNALIAPYLWNAHYMWTGSDISSGYYARNTVTINGNSMSWWTSTNDTGQLNASGKTYYWTAIG